MTNELLLPALAALVLMYLAYLMLTRIENRVEVEGGDEALFEYWDGL
jgi:hypothetical protein